jgi:hypothetical protein
MPVCKQGLSVNCGNANQKHTLQTISTMTKLHFLSPDRPAFSERNHKTQIWNTPQQNAPLPSGRSAFLCHALSREYLSRSTHTAHASRTGAVLSLSASSSPMHRSSTGFHLSCLRFRRSAMLARCAMVIERWPISQVVIVGCPL